MTALFIAFFIFISTAQAEEKKVTLDLYPSVTAVEKGESFDILIRQNIIDGWHTYWTNAGDSGEPMTIEWNAVEGIEFSDIFEPTPNRIEYPPLVNFGHYGEPLFIQTVTVSDNFDGDMINLSGRAMWLVCEDICIPEEQTIVLSMPVNDRGVAINQDLFELARANMPSSVVWDATYTRQGDNFNLNVAVPTNLYNQMTDVEIYPVEWGLIQTTSSIMADITDNGVIFSGLADTRDLNDLKTAKFVIKTNTNAYEINATIQNTTAEAPSTDPQNIFFILFFAFIGGIILNLMPCVFPVLSMKALSLVKLSSHEQKYARKSGLAYTVGIILSFLIIAGVLIALKGAGESIGWGFQLQDPYVVTALATLLFVIGLNLIGLFEISGRFTNIGSNLTIGNDTKSSFFTGVLATLVATPCTAPFMASAIGYALTQNAFVALSVFAMLGFGLAFPYLLLTFIPAAQKILPKPGVWMDTFKQALAFPMFASAIWLIWVLAQQAGDLAVIYVLGLFLSILFIIWFFRKISSRLWRVIVTTFLIGVFIGYSPILAPKAANNYIAFDSYELETILRNNPDQAVFTNMTAAWCITCLVNERTSLSDANVVAAFNDKNIVYMKGDWTNRDTMITDYLESFGRNGVPLYVYYPNAVNGVRPDPIILPQILTPNIVLKTIKGENK
jgi:thiol:disulfide interchange protein DsbD